MKRKLALGMAIVMLLLSGCSGIESSMENTILKKSGILNDSDYKQYLQWQEEGILDESAQYIDQNLLEAQEANRGQIHVTFGKNQYLEIEYYTIDGKKEEKIDINDCYLNPGEKIYAKVITNDNKNSNLYYLEKYWVYEYNANAGKRIHSQEATEENVVYEIPENFTGTELSVIPVGNYRERKLPLEVYSVDDDGNNFILKGVGYWKINDEKVHGDVVEFSPVEAYILQFDFDRENYFFVSSAPQCYTKDPNKVGSVQFKKMSATDEDTKYQVELHPYLSLKMKFSEEAYISLNGEEKQKIKKNGEWENKKLKYNDEIVIETKGECTVLNGDYRHVEASKANLMEGYRYTLVVTEEVEDNVAKELVKIINVNRVFYVELNEKCTYGECTYKLDGKEVSGKVRLQEGQKLTVTYKITKKGYVFSEGADFLNTSEQTKTINIVPQLDGITLAVDYLFKIEKKGDKASE